MGEFEDHCSLLLLASCHSSITILANESIDRTLSICTPMLKPMFGRFDVPCFIEMVRPGPFKLGRFFALEGQRLFCRGWVGHRDAKNTHMIM